VPVQNKVLRLEEVTWSPG